MSQIHTTIFYADDDVDDLDFFSEVAKEIDQPVSLFEDGEKLINKLHNPPPVASVIFLDLNMPLKSGFDVLTEIKSNKEMEDVPVIILTTSNNPDDVRRTKKLGANLYIRKPASVGGLKKAVNHVLSIDWKNHVTSDHEFLYQH